MQPGLLIKVLARNPLIWIDAYGLYDVHIYIDNEHPTGNTIYPAWVIVTDPDNNNEVVGGPFKGSKKPDQSRDKCKGKCTEIAIGVYNYSVGPFPTNLPKPKPGKKLRKRYPALRLGTVPSVGPNFKHNDNYILTGVWFHKGSIASTSAEGCLTLDPKSWDNFIKTIHNGGNSGDVYVYY